MTLLAALTIIVPTRNEAANIETLLETIPAELRLIVVDDSDDGTAEIVRRRRPELTQVLVCCGSITEARELGARAARTPWLLFTDADVKFATGYFATVEELIAGAPPNLAMLLGPKLSPDEFVGHYRRLAAAQRVLAAVRIPAASGSNMLVTTEAFARVGGFDQALTCNEDSELGWRVARAGYGWRYDRRLIAYATDHRRLRRGAFRKTLHTVCRCAALYLGLVPRRWRGHDWGYWHEARSARGRPPLASGPANPADGSARD